MTTMVECIEPGDQNRACNHRNEEKHKSQTISVQGYLQNVMAKAKQALTVDKLNQLVDHPMQFHKSDQCNRTEMEEKVSITRAKTRSMPHTWQLNKYTYAISMDTIRQSENGNK